MKKLTILLSAICLIISACAKVEEGQETEKAKEEEEESQKEEETEKFVDDGVITLINLGKEAEFGHLPSEKEMTAHWDLMHAAACVQGVVNRDKPRLFVAYSGSNGATDLYWWNMYRKTGKWLSGKKCKEETDFYKVVKKYKALFKGLVVYDPNIYSTSNVASTVAGVEDLIAVRYDTSSGSMYNKLREMGFSVKVWLVNRDGSSRFSTKVGPYKWAIENYVNTGKCNCEYAGYYVDQFWNHHILPDVSVKHHQLTNHDFFISKRSFIFDLSPWGDEAATDAPTEGRKDLETLKTLLKAFYDQNGGQKMCHIGGFTLWSHKYTSWSNSSVGWSVGGKHGEVETEWEFVRVASAYNAFIDADALGMGDLANASFWQHYPTENEYPQEWVTREDLMAKGYLKEDGTVDTSKKYVIIYVGDYDSAAWLSNMTQSMWSDSNRGQLPLMWCISPVLAVRAPQVMDYIRKNATPNDYFAAADSGAGYVNPGMLQSPRRISNLSSGLDVWEKHCSEYYTKWGYRVSGFVIDGYSNGMNNDALECYSKFSPGGIVPQIITISDKTAILVNGMPVMKEEAYLDGEPAQAASAALGAMAARDIPFHWFRTVLKTPTWHLHLKENLENADPDIVWMDAPSYFELLKCYLEENQ